MRLITLLALGVTAAGHLAMAQVPPHVPGTICMTPYFWCWAEEQGRVGDVCSCYLLDEALLDAFEGDITGCPRRNSRTCSTRSWTGSMAEAAQTPGAAARDRLLRRLIDDAILVASFGQRAGALGDGALFSAIQAVEEEKDATWASKKVVALQTALNDAINAIAPVTLVDLRTGWDPFGPRTNKHRLASLLRYVYVLLAILLIVPAVHYSQWLKRAEAVVLVQEKDLGGQVEAMIQEINDSFLLSDGNGEIASFADLDTGPTRAVLRARLREARRMDVERRAAHREYNMISDRFYLGWSVLIGGNIADLWKDYTLHNRYLSESRTRARMRTTGPPPITDPYPCEKYLRNGTMAATGDKPSEERLAVLAETENKPAAVLSADGHMQLVSQFNRRIGDDETRIKVLRCLVGADVPVSGAKYDDADLKQKIETVGLWLLPALFGAFGAVVYHLRVCWNRLRPDPRFGRAILRIFLGAFGGIAFGWFWAPAAASDLLPQTLPLSAYAIAFLIGYSIDIFFALLDRLVAAISRAINNIGGEKPRPAVD